MGLGRGFASGLLAGTQAAKSWVDMYNMAQDRADRNAMRDEMKSVMDTSPTQTQAFSDDQALQIKQAGEYDQPITQGLTPGSVDIWAKDGMGPAQTLTPTSSYSFMGKSYDTMPTEAQIDRAKGKALGTVLAQHGYAAEGLRVRSDTGKIYDQEQAQADEELKRRNMDAFTTESKDALVALTNKNLAPLRKIYDRIVGNSGFATMSDTGDVTFNTGQDQPPVTVPPMVFLNMAHNMMGASRTGDPVEGYTTLMQGVQEQQNRGLTLQHNKKRDDWEERKVKVLEQNATTQEQYRLDQIKARNDQNAANAAYKQYLMDNGGGLGGRGGSGSGSAANRELAAKYGQQFMTATPFETAQITGLQKQLDSGAIDHERFVALAKPIFDTVQTRYDVGATRSRYQSMPEGERDAWLLKSGLSPDVMSQIAGKPMRAAAPASAQGTAPAQQGGLRTSSGVAPQAPVHRSPQSAAAESIRTAMRATEEEIARLREPTPRRWTESGDKEARIRELQTHLARLHNMQGRTLP